MVDTTNVNRTLSARVWYGKNKLEQSRALVFWVWVEFRLQTWDVSLERNHQLSRNSNRISTDIQCWEVLPRLLPLTDIALTQLSSYSPYYRLLWRGHWLLVRLAWVLTVVTTYRQGNNNLAFFIQRPSNICSSRGHLASFYERNFKDNYLITI